jgi:Ankyrin repeats (many copies)/2OG-Fe(II) oxygenase superfamily
MRQHNNNSDDGRKCWQTARERERLRARFLIRDRVAAEASAAVNETSSDFPQSPSHKGTRVDPLLVMNTPSQVQLVLQNLQCIQNGDRSKFSLTLMSKQCELLSSVIPTNHLILEDSSVLPHALDLCVAWFGREYSTFLQEYIASLSGFSTMEYAVWMGKYSILGSLLVGGINPCLRSRHVADDQDDDKEGVVVNGKSLQSQNVTWQERSMVIGTRVVQRLYDGVPLPLKCYIVKRVVDMRMNAFLVCKKSESERHADLGSTACPLCGEVSVPLSFRLYMSPCNHSFCEPCFWKDFLFHIDDRGEVDDVILCPVCGQTGIVPSLIDKYNRNGCCPPSEHDAKLVGKKHLDVSPAQRSLKSLRRLSLLPLDRKALKDQGSKRKKIPEAQQLVSSWYGAVAPSLGSTQEVRRDKFFANIERNAIHFVRGCLVAGVNVNWTNEYGQTPLYLAAWRGNSQMVDLLLHYGADPWISANGGSTVHSICAWHGHSQCVALLEEYLESMEVDVARQVELVHPLTSPLGNEEAIAQLSYVTLIEEELDHAGAGSYLIDETISSQVVNRFLKLWKSLPQESSHKKKSSAPCSVRSYYCDAERHVCRLLKTILERAGLASPSQPTLVFPYMRFLDYAQEGIVLAPHVDLCRVDPGSGQRSTHSFLLYLTDCERGGETTLLGDLSGEGRSQALATIAPKHGRLLLFPHACPHEGNQVIDVPKILLRGEVMLSKVNTLETATVEL